jgi:hypothetical protein
VTDKVKTEQQAYRWPRRYVFAATLAAIITLIVLSIVA